MTLAYTEHRIQNISVQERKTQALLHDVIHESPSIKQTSSQWSEF